RGLQQMAGDGARGEILHRPNIVDGACPDQSRAEAYAIMDIELMVVPYDSSKRSERTGAGPQALIDGGLVARLEQRGDTVQRTVIDAPVGQWRAEIRTAFDLAKALAIAVR